MMVEVTGGGQALSNVVCTILLDKCKGSRLTFLIHAAGLGFHCMLVSCHWPFVCASSQSITATDDLMMMCSGPRLVVFLPQIIENYQRQSGEGLSVFFIVIWLIGDLCSLSGAILAHLLPTIIILATYVSDPFTVPTSCPTFTRIFLPSPIQYAVCDSILLLQIYYYRWTRSALSERTSLLVSDETIPNLTEETALLRENSRESSQEKTKKPILREFAKYAGALAFVFVVGIAAWAVDEYIHQGVLRPGPGEILEWKSQVLGWVGATMFCKCMLVSRLISRIFGRSSRLKWAHGSRRSVGRLSIRLKHCSLCVLRRSKKLQVQM